MFSGLIDDARVEAIANSNGQLTNADFFTDANGAFQAVPVGDAYEYEIDFSGSASGVSAAPTLARNLIRAIKASPTAAKGIDLHIKREHKGGSVVNGVLQGGTTVEVSPYTSVTGWAGLAATYMTSGTNSDKLIIKGYNTQLDELFDAVDTDAPAPGN